MNFPLSFPSFVIFVHFFWRVSSYMEMEKLKKAIACDDVGIVKEFLDGENKEGVLRGTLIIKLNNRFLEPREDSRPRLPGNGALHWAVMRKSPKVTRLLLENGADVDMLNFQGLSPLFLATMNYICMDPPLENHTRENGESVADVLFDFNPDILIRNDSGLSPLICAAGYCNVSLVAKLVARGGNVNDKWMRLGRIKTALNRAVYNGCVEVTKFLLENGAEADADDGHGVNALHMIFNTRNLYWISTRQTAMNDQASIARLLLRSENVENMLRQRKSRENETPMDEFFKHLDPNREILVDLLKILPTLDDEYAEPALRTLSPSLLEDSYAWPLNNFPDYVKVAFNSYLEIPIEKSRTIGGFVPRITFLNCVSPARDIKYFMEHGFYSLYVVLKTHFRIRRGRDREKAVVEVEKFEEYLRELSAPFQNALSNALAEGATLASLPNDIVTKIFLRSQYAPYIERLAKIMSLVQFTRKQRLSGKEMVDAAPAFIPYVERRDIFLL